jgi:hypothetical protein
MFATKTHKNALPATVAHGFAAVNEIAQRKINGIKHLAVVSHRSTRRKNRFKNKDLRE